MSTTTIESTSPSINIRPVGGSNPSACLSGKVALPPSPVGCSSGTTSSFDEIEGEIRALAKTCGNTRVAKKFLGDRQKIVGFLSQIAQIAWSEHAKALSVEADDLAQEPCTFVRTVEELSAQSGCSSHQVDKFLRWADKGLRLLRCPIPKDKKIRQRQITIDVSAVRDLKLLFDPGKRVGYWDLPAEVHVNGFKYKSLSNFCLNFAVGCSFGCHFCYVPSVSTINLGWRLIRYGVLDADYDWGTYTLIRRWDEEHFRASLHKMLALSPSELGPDGHMAIMLSTDTDPYMPVFHPDPAMREELRRYLKTMVRRCLEILLEPEFERFKVRIQTRGLDAEHDFDLMEQFGNRLLFGMSIPTLDNALAKVYEPRAPGPTRRLEIIRKAIARGIACYVAMAPTYPECGEADLRKTLGAFANLPLYTIFHEPINARAKNVDRIMEDAERRKMTVTPQAQVIRHPSTRIPYAIEQLKLVEKIAGDLGIHDKLHLWPDEELTAESVISSQSDPDQFHEWLRRCHGRIPCFRPHFSGF